MSERYDDEYSGDEPVIGATYAPPPPPPLEPVYIGGSYAPPPGNGYSENGYVEDQYADEDEYYDDEDGDGYYEEADYDDTAPVRQPMFYVFIALAALVGGIVVFLLFSLVDNSKDDPQGTGDTKFNVSIDSPPKDKRIEIGKAEDVLIQASATEPIVRFELFVGDKLTDSVEVSETPTDNKYRSLLHLTLTTKGNYDIFVKVTAVSGATRESSKVRVIAIEPVGERPQTIKGKVVADTTLRVGPGDSFAEAGTLKGGQEVTILGKSRNVDWLLIDSPQGGRWAKRTAIDPLDSLDLVPARDVTPTPAPTAPPTSTTLPSPSPSASVSPSPSPNSPDFVPTEALLVDGGKRLRVTVANQSSSAYKGPLVISLQGDVPASQSVFDATLAANGSGIFEFEFKEPVVPTEKSKVDVTVDPQNAVKEQRENNNVATIILRAAEQAPAIGIASLNVGSTIEVVLKNSGGALATTDVTIKVTLGGDSTSKTTSLALAPNQSSAVISATKPTGSGEATIEVVIGGQTVASVKAPIP